MNRNEFEQLLYLVLDGEAQPADQERFAAALAESAEFRARYEFETELQRRLVDSLHEHPDQLAHSRIMSGLRAGIAAESGPRQEPNLAAERPSVTPSWRRFLAPVAGAAAIILAFWLGSQSANDDAGGRGGVKPDPTLKADLDQPVAHDLATASRASEIHFQEDIAAEQEKIGCPRRSAEHCIEAEKGKVWSRECGVDCQARLAEARSMLSKCIGDDLSALGLPEGFELVGYRNAQIKFDETEISAPHLVFMSDSCRVSVYVICAQNGTHITDGLHELEAKDKKNQACLWGCPQKGLVVRRVGKAWIAISADISLDELQKIASDF